MNKSELIEALATKAELSKAAAGRAVDVLVEEIVTAVAKGDSVTLVGFGTFKPAARAARDGHRRGWRAPCSRDAGGGSHPCPDRCGLRR